MLSALIARRKISADMRGTERATFIMRVAHQDNLPRLYLWLFC